MHYAGRAIPGTVQAWLMSRPNFPASQGMQSDDPIVGCRLCFGLLFAIWMM
jgi:hypothetical protein